jgi:hypothetical protein
MFLGHKLNISFDHKFVFFDIPKSASTSIDKAIKPISQFRIAGRGAIKHCNVKDYEQHIEPFLVKRLGEEVREFERIAVVREPIDMLRSLYRYLQRPGVEVEGHTDHEKYTGNVEFQEFCLAVCGEGTRVGHRWGAPKASEFLSDEYGIVKVDSIFSFDDLDGVADYLSRRCGARIEMPQMNSTSGTEEALDSTALSLIEERFKRETAIWSLARGCEFGTPLRIKGAAIGQLNGR